MKQQAFTLIELLVVVAIIAILAAIAVPNFLAAQTRAKVSRVKADLRTLATAVEAYTVDHNIPPLDWNVSRGDPMYADMISETSGVLHPGREAGRAGLTTPVAYIANCWIDDPFASSSLPFDQRKYTYNWFAPNPNRGVPVRDQYSFQEYDKYYGAWRLGSIGPDRQFFHSNGDLVTVSRIYDPTNGTSSLGNIWRSQREPEVAGRPPLDVLVDP